jgi:hypothetical protein
MTVLREYFPQRKLLIFTTGRRGGGRYLIPAIAQLPLDASIAAHAMRGIVDI